MLNNLLDSIGDLNEDLGAGATGGATVWSPPTFVALPKKSIFRKPVQPTRIRSLYKGGPGGAETRSQGTLPQTIGGKFGLPTPHNFPDDIIVDSFNRIGLDGTIRMLLEKGYNKKEISQIFSKAQRSGQPKYQFNITLGDIDEDFNLGATKYEGPHKSYLKKIPRPHSARPLQPEPGCSIKIITPAYSQWQIGDTEEITWTSINAGSFVTIDLLRDGKHIETLSKMTDNDNSFYWEVNDYGDGPGDNYEIKISSREDPGCYKTSERFTITKNGPILDALEGLDAQLDISKKDMDLLHSKGKLPVSLVYNELDGLAGLFGSKVKIDPYYVNGGSQVKVMPILAKATNSVFYIDADPNTISQLQNNSEFNSNYQIGESDRVLAINNFDSYKNMSDVLVNDPRVNPYGESELAQWLGEKGIGGNKLVQYKTTSVYPSKFLQPAGIYYYYADESDVAGIGKSLGFRSLPGIVKEKTVEAFTKTIPSALAKIGITKGLLSYIGIAIVIIAGLYIRKLVK